MEVLEVAKCMEFPLTPPSFPPFPLPRLNHLWQFHRFIFVSQIFFIDCFPINFTVFFFSTGLIVYWSAYCVITSWGIIIYWCLPFLGNFGSLYTAVGSAALFLAKPDNKILKTKISFFCWRMWMISKPSLIIAYRLIFTGLTASFFCISYYSLPVGLKLALWTGVACFVKFR